MQPFHWPHLLVPLFLPVSVSLSSIPPSLGLIMTAVADLDRETQDRYELVVKATDMAGQMGGLSGSTTVTIVITDVNDNPPRFPQSECVQHVCFPSDGREGDGETRRGGIRERKRFDSVKRKRARSGEYGGKRKPGHVNMTKDTRCNLQPAGRWHQ